MKLTKIRNGDSFYGTGFFIAGAYYNGCMALYTITHQSAYVGGQATGGAMKIWGEDVTITTNGYNHTFSQSGLMISGL